MTDSELIEEIALQIKSGNSDTTAANVRALLTEFVNSKQNIDGKNANDGYAGLNSNGKIGSAQLSAISPAGLILYDNGTFGDKESVVRASTDITMDSRWSGFSYAGGSTSTWILPAVRGNKIYELVNRGGGNLTLNYPGASNLILDLQNGTLVNTFVVPSMSRVTIMDDGLHLIID